ncbi:DUF4383 domain-containing protein [Candidatus Woesearchaeota archaeon]|nr:DUF4383 domain-containing protein [Candidatus Woesearchaeota archaeon]
MGLQKNFATGLGAVLTIVGIWGFLSTGSVLGFGVTTAHNLVHLVSGVLGLLAGLTADGEHAKTYNIVFGVIYGITTILGLLNVAAIVDLLSLNTADNILHLVITLAALGVGFGAQD